MQQKKGFTLIEVLVALTIIAIAMLAIVQTVQVSINSTQKVQDRTVASWVAMNLLTYLQSGLLSFTEDKKLSGETMQANKNWFWSIEQDKETDYSLQVSIKVTTNKNASPIVRLTGFVPK